MHASVNDQDSSLILERKKGADLVTLPPFEDLVANPDLIKDLMIEQGVEGVASVEVTGAMSGGTSDHNDKGYIHWTDGTSTKVIIKGSRTGESKPTSYRESLFYSRMADTLPETVPVTPHYLAVADKKSGEGFFIIKFMEGYSSLAEVFAAAANPEDLTSMGITDFDYRQTNMDVMTMLGSYAASHWMDYSLNDQFYLKGYGWDKGHGHTYYAITKSIVNKNWTKTKRALRNKHNTYEMDANTQACMQKVFDRWSWNKFQHILRRDDTYNWGFVHGDFHSGQMMYNQKSADLVLLDWEFSGIFGNPAIDLATWMFGLPHTQLE